MALRKALIIGAITIALACVSGSLMAKDSTANFDIVYAQLMTGLDKQVEKVFKPFRSESMLEKTSVYEPLQVVSIDAQAERFYYLTVSDDQYAENTNRLSNYRNLISWPAYQNRTRYG